MINTLAQIDYFASAGRSPWHQASALTKLVLVLSIIAIAVFSSKWAVLLALLATALVMATTAGLPVRLVLVAASSPLLFSLVFALARWHGDWHEMLPLLLRPVIASLAALWLVGTTPYPDLFAPLSRVLPRVVGDSLFLTYRAVFSLLDRVERLSRALFLRGAMSGPVRRKAELMGEAVGTVVLYGFERSQRMYQVMHLRGHSGRICGCRHWLEVRREDAWVIGTFVWVAAAWFLLGGL